MLDGEQWRWFGGGVVANSWRWMEESRNCWPDVHDPEKWTRVRETNVVKEKKKGEGQRESDRLPESQLVKEGRRRQEEPFCVFFGFFFLQWRSSKP